MSDAALPRVRRGYRVKKAVPCALIRNGIHELMHSGWVYEEVGCSKGDNLWRSVGAFGLLPSDKFRGKSKGAFPCVPLVFAFLPITFLQHSANLPCVLVLPLC